MLVVAGLGNKDRLAIGLYKMMCSNISHDFSAWVNFRL